MRRVSPKRAKDLKIYHEAVRDWNTIRLYLDGGRCEFFHRGGERCEHNGHEHPHHRGGRLGKLLYYMPWFMKVCGPCHRKIHITDVAHARWKKYIIDKDYRNTEKQLDHALPTSHTQINEEEN